MEALSRLRSDPVTAELRVVALTAFAMKEDRERLLAAGFDGYLEKPLDVRRVPGQVSRAAVGRPRQGDVTSDPVILVVDDLPRTCGCCEAVLEPRGYDGRDGDVGAEALERVASRADRPGAARRVDAGDGRLRGLPKAASRARPRSFLPVVMITASGEQEKVAGDRGRRGRLRHEAVRPGRAAGPGALAASHQGVPRHDRRAGRRAGRMERTARAARRAAGRRAGAGRPAKAVPVAAARRTGRIVGRRLVPGEPPPRDHGRVLRPARLHGLRGDRRARGRDGGARPVPRGAG